MSSNNTPSTPKDAPTAVNPVSMARFRRQSWWQIIFPVVFATLIGVGLVVLVALGGPDVAAVVADYSLVLILLLNLLFAVTFIAIFVVLTVILIKAIKFLPPYTNVAHESVQGINTWVDDQTTKVAGWVITAKSVMTGLTLYLETQGIIPDQKNSENGNKSGEQETLQTKETES